MTETAVVIKTNGRTALLRIEKHPECEGCKACAFKNGASTVKVKARNLCGAKTGQKVIVKGEKDNRVLASFIAYLLPVIFVALGLIPGFVFGMAEIYIFLLGMAGLAAGIAVVVILDKVLGKTKGFGLEVYAVLPEEPMKEGTDGEPSPAPESAETAEDPESESE